MAHIQYTEENTRIKMIERRDSQLPLPLAFRASPLPDTVTLPESTCRTRTTAAGTSPEELC
jgi:hypothetical protein